MKRKFRIVKLFENNKEYFIIQEKMLWLFWQNGIRGISFNNFFNDVEIAKKFLSDFFKKEIVYETTI